MRESHTNGGELQGNREGGEMFRTVRLPEGNFTILNS